jgi:hypothetical protein
MPTINIDNQSYDTETLSDEAKAQLEMLIASENKLRELQRDVMITQTARNAYLNALKASLPTPMEQVLGQGGTLKLS